VTVRVFFFVLLVADAVAGGVGEGMMNIRRECTAYLRIIDGRIGAWYDVLGTMTF
jgi:hypothetical protein